MKLRLALGVAVLTLILGSGVAFAKTIIGNANNNTIYGTSYGDSIYGYGGSDRLYGRGGTDYMYGGAGSDVIVVDDDAVKDYVYCGTGTDTVYARANDVIVSGCEKVVRSAALTVTVGCTSNPETTRIHNNRPYSILVTTVGSIYDVTTSEPYSVQRWLAPGATVTFQSGAAATSNALTTRYIYNNNVGSTEGARVTTQFYGTFVDRCG